MADINKTVDKTSGDGTSIDYDSQSPLHYWIINVPESQRPTECPEFLLDISDRNKEIINLPQDEYNILSWPEVQDLIKTNQIDKFRRSPLDHRKYLEYMFGLKKKYGSVMDFVRDERVEWTDLEPRGKAFENPDDLKILYNDWPYGIDSRIVHLVVWTKFDLEEDPETNELTPAMRESIDEYVDKTFGSKVPSTEIRWFKNWGSLKSIHSIEHFHIMLNDPDLDLIKEVTNGDVAVSSQLGS